jgi:hypothetical protein
MRESIHLLPRAPPIADVRQVLLACHRKNKIAGGDEWGNRYWVIPSARALRKVPAIPAHVSACVVLPAQVGTARRA